MASQTPTQSFANHGRIVPLYHGVAFGALVINFLYAAWQVVRAPGAGTLVAVILAIGLILLFFFARLFALKVQDRVIRLEMRLRMKELLPSELQSRIGEFTIDQLVALRFASDGELPQLAAKVLQDNIGDRKAIKQMIQEWQGDYLRA